MKRCQVIKVKCFSCRLSYDKDRSNKGECCSFGCVAIKLKVYVRCKHRVISEKARDFKFLVNKNPKITTKHICDVLNIDVSSGVRFRQRIERLNKGQRISKKERKEQQKQSKLNNDRRKNIK